MRTLDLARPKEAAWEPLEDLRMVDYEDSVMGQDKVGPRLEGRP